MTRLAPAVAYRLTQPFCIEAVEQEVRRERRGDVLLRPLLTGVCASDLKLYAGTRDRRALFRKLPLALLHEGVAQVVEGPPTAELRPGSRAVVIPNIPCWVARPERYPSRHDACLACRPGGAGENYCLDPLYLSSNTDGLARTLFRHPASLLAPVPAGIPDRVAVFTEPLTTILAGCQKARLRPDARYLILGDGPLAQLVAVCLIGFYAVPPAAITMTVHERRHGDGLERLVGTVVDATAADSLAGREDSIDVAFECVGGAANEHTLAQAVDALKPGGTAVLFGPSEVPVPFNTRDVIGKGLIVVGANRSRPHHFRAVLERLADPALQTLLETVVSPEAFQVRDAGDLNRALYHAWTKPDAGKTLVAWAGPE